MPSEELELGMLQIVTCYGCHRTFPREVATVLDDDSEINDRCLYCGTLVRMSLRRGTGHEEVV